MNKLTIQEWVFSEASGRYHVDLGGSNVLPLTLTDILNGDVFTNLTLGYAHELGDHSLREKIASKYINRDANNILICHGGQEAFSLLSRAVSMDNKTEAIIVGSNWSQHLEFSKECAFQVHFVSVTNKEDHAIIEDIQKHTNSMTGMIILASPDNPTGWVASTELLTLINELVVDSDVVVIVDEEYLIDHSKSASRLSKNIAATSSLSKMHGLPGLRLGWCVAHPNLIKRCLDAKRLTTISNSIMSEELAKIALNKEDVYLTRGKELCKNGNELIRKWVDINPNLEIMGTTEILPYAWIKLQEKIDSMSFARNALRHGVLIIPGDVFSQPGFIRLATGRNVDVINNGLQILTPLLSHK